MGVRSRLKFTDCFSLPPQVKSKPETTAKDQRLVNDDDIIHKDKILYAWSIYGNLHVMDFSTFEWEVVSEVNIDKQP